MPVYMYLQALFFRALSHLCSKLNFSALEKMLISARAQREQSFSICPVHTATELLGAEQWGAEKMHIVFVCSWLDITWRLYILSISKWCRELDDMLSWHFDKVRRKKNVPQHPMPDLTLTAVYTVKPPILPCGPVWTGPESKLALANV